MNVVELGVSIFIGLVGLLVVCIILATATGAHDEWSYPGKYYNKNGEDCCSKHDCKQVKAQENGTGYYIIAPHNEQVPWSEVLMSPDEKFWRCGNMQVRRCFFAPPNSF